MEAIEVLRYGDTGLLFLMLVGAGWMAREFLARQATADRELISSLRSITAELAAHELRDVERHASMERHVSDHMRRSSEEHAEIAGEVAIALAELRGQRRAEDEAAERPTPAGGVPHMGRSRG